MADPTQDPPGRGRLVLGCVLLVLSIVPWAIAPFTALLAWPGGRLAATPAALLILAEVIGAAALAVLGREAYARITRRLRRRRDTTRDGQQIRRCELLENEIPHE
jgi:hypothetical protein